MEIMKLKKRQKLFDFCQRSVSDTDRYKNDFFFENIISTIISQYCSRKTNNTYLSNQLGVSLCYFRVIVSTTKCFFFLYITFGLHKKVVGQNITKYFTSSHATTCVRKQATKRKAY